MEGTPAVKIKIKENFDAMIYQKLSDYNLDPRTKKQRRLGEELGPTSREEMEEMVADYLRANNKITICATQVE
jgi:hypothetical protein